MTSARTPRHRLVLSIAALLGATMALPASGTAQPSVEVSLARAFDSVRLEQAASEGRQATDATVSLEQLAADKRLRVYYDLDAATYSTSGDWTSWLHHVGGTYRIGLGNEGRHGLFVGGSAWLRANGTSWADAGFHGVTGFTNLEAKPRDTLTLRSGYRFDGRTFPDLPDLNQHEHTVFGSVLASFPTRTTLVAEVQSGAKTYEGATLIVRTIADGTADHVTQGALRGLGPTVRGVIQASAIVQPSTRARQVTSLFRVAQSLAARTGAWIQYTGRRTGGRVAPVLVTTPAWFFDDGVYDDPFASESDTAAIGGRHQLASGAALDVQASRATRRYTATPALDETGEPLGGDVLRADGIWRGSAGWTQPLFPSRTGDVALDLVTSYRFLRHRSNDAFYRYTSHALTLGVSLAY